MHEDRLLIVLTDIDAGAEDEWHRWYDEVHLPNMLRVPELKWAARYDIVADPHSAPLPYRFATVQGFASAADFDRYRASTRFPQLRDEYVERYGSTSRLGRLVLEKRPAWRGRESADQWQA
jgi:hypothetical protein